MHGLQRLTPSGGARATSRPNMERLQKVLAQAGIASRRAAEQIIMAGRVRVDGKIVRELGTQVDPRKSRVEVDGNKIVAEKLVYIVLHKPRGVVCTLSDPEGRPTIRELLKEAGARVVPVGRLDFHTSGALLCTNDGEFAQALAHPKREVPKVYVAKVKGTVDDDALPKFSERIEIDGRATQPAQVKRLRYEGDKTWLELTLREGRNRQVRRLGEATGFPVMRLVRISHAGITSEDLRPGQWRPLTIDELVDLKKVYGVPKKVRAPQLEPLTGRAAKGRLRAARPDVRGEAFKPAREVRGSSRADSRAAAAPSDRRAGRGFEEGHDARSSGRTGRGEAKPFGRGEAKSFGRGEAKSFGRGEAKPFGRGEAKSFGRGEAKSFGRGEARPSGRGEAKSFGRGEAKSFGRGEAKSFGRGEAKSFGRGEAKPFGRGEAKSFGRGEARPSGRGEAKSFGRGEAKRSDAKRFAPADEKTTAKRGGRGSAPRRGTSR
jgi:23S rRNA pseudouridine2605 synthase